MWSIFHPKHPVYRVRPIAPSELPGILRRNIWTGVLGALAINFLTGGVFFTAYCLNMGMNDKWFGLLYTLTAPMVVFTMLAGVLEERFGHRKYPFFILALASRLALGPMLLGAILAVPPWAVVAMVVAFAALSNLSTPLWLSWTWSYIPADRFARFSAVRSSWATLVQMPVALAGAFAVESVPPRHRTLVFCAIFSLLIVAGVVDLVCHIHIPEPPREDAPEKSVSRIREVLRNAPMRNLLLATMIWNFGVMVGGPFCLPYMMAELGYRDRIMSAALLTSVLPSLATLAALWAWGRLLDRTSTGPILTVSYALWATIPLFYYFAPPDSPDTAMMLVWLVGGIAPWGAVLATPLLLARLSGRDKTMPAALWLITSSLGSMVGSALGTWIVANFGGSRPAFMVSFAARAAAACIVFLLVVCEPWARRRGAAARGPAPADAA